MAHKYCWLDIETGEFSLSWDEETMQECGGPDIIPEGTVKWKLIKYECVNDDDFVFNNLMRIK